jgi:hypothetical protein
MYRLFIVLFVLTTATGCIKKGTGLTPNRLPAATTTGANRFGCLVDGKVFVPNKELFAGGVILQCNYEFVESRYSLILAARNYIEDYAVVINIDNIQLSGDTILSFSSPLSGPVSGRCGDVQNDLTMRYSTTNKAPGELKFTKFDLVNQIASGTFWFDAVDSTTGKIVQVRDGRFDVPFTR